MNSISIFDKTNSKNKYNNLFCKNCGKYGHIHRYCKDATISLGIILVRKKQNKLEYLLIRRRNSIGYVQFIRGKYHENDLDYIQQLFNEMSMDEKKIILHNDFEFLWFKLWNKNIKNQNHRSDFLIAKNKFKKINIKYFIEKSSTSWIETEWGFPKGRRDLKETNLQTAKREFMEETGILVDNIDIFKDKVFIELYRGSDNKFYKHIYFLAKLKNETNLDKLNIYQSNEVSKVCFKDYEKSQKKIRNYHLSKLKILNEIDNILNEKNNEIFK